MVDTTAMCICPCNLSSTRSHRTSLLYYTTSGGVISSSRFHQNSQVVHNVTTNANNTTSASAALSSSICYCPCSTATSTSYMSCKHACGFIQFIIKICQRMEVLYVIVYCVYRKFKEYSAVCLWYSLKIFWSFLAFQTTTVSVSQSMPLSSTESASDNMSLAVSLTSSPALSLEISKSTVAEMTSQSGFFTSSFSSSLSMSELLSFLYESVHSL